MSAVELAVPGITPGIGLWPDVPLADYQAWDACSNTRLRHIQRSPAHLRAYIDQPPAPTPALVFGNAAHTAVLEPDDFPARYVLAGQCEARTKKGERCSNGGRTLSTDVGWLCGVHDGGVPGDERDARIALSAEHYAACLSIRDQVRSHRKVGLIFAMPERAQRELSALWMQACDLGDDEGGVLCKGRMDYLQPHFGVALDLKTTTDAGLDSFEKSIFAYNYHIQAALYLDALAHFCPGEYQHFVIVAIEKEPPWAVAGYRLTDDAVEAGRKEMGPLLTRYARCLQAHEWPGYQEEITDIGIPEWAYRRVYGW